MEQIEIPSTMTVAQVARLTKAWLSWGAAPTQSPLVFVARDAIEAANMRSSIAKVQGLGPKSFVCRECGVRRPGGDGVYCQDCM